MVLDVEPKPEMTEKDEPWLEIASRFRFCHGTSTALKDSIQKYGLVPRKRSGKSVYKDWDAGATVRKDLESTKEGVYLSSWIFEDPGASDHAGFCDVAAQNTVKKFGGEPMIVEIKLSKDDLRNHFDYDEDSYKGASNLYAGQCKVAFKENMLGKLHCFEPEQSKIIQRAIKDGIITEKEACEDAPYWFKELMCMNKFVFETERIPPEKLTRFTRWHPGERHEKID